MFGKTYGKTTFKSSTGEFNWGPDLPSEKKFVSMLQKEFWDQKTVLFDTAAKIVGVDKKEDIYKRPINPNTVNKFWGIDKVDDDVVNNVGLEESKKAFFASDPKFSTTEIQRRQQAQEEALKNFYGVPEKADPAGLVPIPGYSGVSWRVVADNIFGMTYAEARKCAEESLKKINDEKGETLKANSVFVPEYKRPPPEDEFW